MTTDVTTQLGKLFALLFMMMGPFAAMPIFAMLTQGADAALTRQIATRASGFAAISVAVAALLGYGVLPGWWASPTSLVIAAGLLLLLSSLKHALAPASPPPSGPLPSPTIAIALSPLAFPLIVTPPAIGVLIIFTAYFRETSHQFAILGIGLAVVALDYLAMRVAKPVMRWMGPVPLRILGAVFGVLQVALGVEFIISGLLRTGLMK